MTRGINSLGHEVGHGYGLPFYHTEIVVANLFILLLFFSIYTVYD